MSLLEGAVQFQVSGPNKEIPVTTSNLNQIPVQDEVLVLGGGVAGCAAAIALARKGRELR